MSRLPGRIESHQFQMRVSAAFLKSIDRWRHCQIDKPSRGDAVRRIVEQVLVSKVAPRRRSKDAARKASHLATRAIEGLSDKSQPVEEQQRRKRTLIHGPKEFRDIRDDQSDIKS
jgi:hypothetical protein